MGRRRPIPSRLIGPPLGGLTSYAISVAFSPDGRTLAAGVTDGTVWLWSTGARPALLTTLTGPAGHVYSVAFRPGGRALAAASADGTVRLWATRPDAAAEAVCATAGQPLTRPEWDTYVPGLAYQPRPAADGLTRPHLRLTGRPPGRRLPPRRLRNASIQLMK